jgi:ABC-type dipeptide/oligopeptide/nickel transport system permease subunit
VTAIAESESPSPAPAAEEPGVRTRGYWAQAFRRLRRQPVTLFAFTLLVTIVVVGLFAQQLEPQHWNHLDLSPRWANHAPTVASHHWLGTDHIGRDVVARTIWGLHYTEQTALVGGLAATLLGIVIGGLAGFYGGWRDAVLMRIVDLITGFPVIVLMIAAFAFLTPVTVFEATLVFSLAMWTFVARVVRARVASLLPEEFVQAARSLGASDARIFFRHLLPNAAGTIIVAGTSVFGQIVLIEATAEFFGFGVNSLIRPTLGNLVAEATSSGIGAYNFLGLGWWVWVPPAVLLVLILVCVNLVGDGFDAALNPRAARR